MVGGQSSQDGGVGVELRVESREESILRQLGVVHLNCKVARPRRYSDDETDATILKEAGVSYVNTSEYEEGESNARKEEQKRER